IDAATTVLPQRDADGLRPNKQGTIVTPSQRCSADTKNGVQCAQRTAVAHLCWNHLLRDVGVRVQPSSVPGAGRGLFAGRHAGLAKGHRIPYTGDAITLDRDATGGPYVLQTRQGAGIDAARRNCGLGRWVNDKRGAVDEHGRTSQANCEFVLHTPQGGDGVRVAAVRTLRPVLRGEELLVKYGSDYWRFHSPSAATKKKQQQRRTQQRSDNSHRARDRHFEGVLVMTLATMDAAVAGADTPAPSGRNLRPTASRRSARAEAAVRVQPERGSARVGRSAVMAPAVETAVAAHQDALHHEEDNAAPDERKQDERPAAPEALMSAMRRAAATDDEYQRWLQSPPPHTRVNRGLLFDGKGCMRVPADAALRTRILAELHDSTTGAHCGRDRMLSEAQRRFDWRGMASDVERCVQTCDACQRNKHSKQLKPGLLMPLPLPEEPCVHWTTDAVTGLQRSKRGVDAIQVYVDRLTKLKRFAVARTTDGSVQLANTTLRTIIGPHGMPKSMVSDRDPRITARFWKELSRVLGSEVNLSTAHHPQSDGQSE
ncbi:hypothetical protein, partial [Dyella sp.]|uniref:hypothetical protein n=1 Tax=Dyella sp. TaxID=1869338 RepID=UPI0028518C78